MKKFFVLMFCLVFTASLMNAAGADPKKDAKAEKKEVKAEKKDVKADKKDMKVEKKEAKAEKKEAKADAKAAKTEKGADKVVGKTKDGKDIYEGPKGGKYTMGSDGKKNYLPKDKK